VRTTATPPASSALKAYEAAALGDQNDPPPEPGLARREAHYARLKRDHLRRRLKRLNITTARKEGAHGGTRRFPRAPERQRRVEPPAAAPGVSIPSGEINPLPTIGAPWKATARRLLALRPSQRLRAFRRHIVARPLQYDLASGRGVQGEPHYRTAFGVGQVAQSSDFENRHFTAFFPMGMTLLRDITQSELAQR
jgi:hypothetical protein